MKENHVIYSIPDNYMELLVSKFLNKDSKSLNSGITLLGTRIGYGKTSTANTMMHNIETNPDLDWVKIFYLHNKEMGLLDITFENMAKQLMSDYLPSKVLVVIDDMSTLDSMKAAISLSRAGYAVFGLVETGIHRGVSAVLEGALSHSKGHEKQILASWLLPELKLMIFQSDTCPMTCSYLHLDKSDNAIYIDIINEKGMDYLLKEVIDKRDDVANVNYGYLYTKEKKVRKLTKLKRAIFKKPTIMKKSR